MNSKSSIFLLLFVFVNGFFFSCKDTDSGPISHDAPREIISVAQAFEMYDAYSTRRVPIIQKYEDSISSDSASFEPTRYAEYDLKTIKQYIAYIEHEAMKANVEINTLRFYLSNYPDKEKFEDGKPVRYPRKNSFFVVPTIDHKGKNVGFSIEENDGKFSAVPISRRNVGENETQKTEKDSTGQQNEAGFFVSNSNVSSSGASSLILNDGNLTPPPGTEDFGKND
jgi:hypothetical protein